MGAFPGGLQGVRCDYKADFPHGDKVSAVFFDSRVTKNPKMLTQSAFWGF
jgi:hypothetical protein